MARSKSSDRWLRRHFSDAYVHQAQQAGYRSRAAFKLMEINNRDRLLRHGMKVVDLGAAPGGWSQIAIRMVGGQGQVIALDILPMKPLPGVMFLQGDFEKEEVCNLLLEKLHGNPVDLVMSDMAPNISGMRTVDQPRAMYLSELAFGLARRVLVAGGGLLVKVFQGEGFDVLRGELQACFDKVVVRKPKASRPDSREVYLLARGYIL